jgi:hypothetical protein
MNVGTFYTIFRSVAPKVYWTSFPPYRARIPSVQSYHFTPVTLVAYFEGQGIWLPAEADIAGRLLGMRSDVVNRIEGAAGDPRGAEVWPRVHKRLKEIITDARGPQG